MLSISPSRHDISHATTINAPIEAVWQHLIDVGDWEWNPWFRLDAENGALPREGLPGKLRASYEGDGKWETFDFRFGEVVDGSNDGGGGEEKEENRRLLSWGGTVGPGGVLFKGRHSVRLERSSSDDNSSTTRLVHEEAFSGLLPALNLGLPYSKLDRNYLLFNEALKEYVESRVGHVG